MLSESHIDTNKEFLKLWAYLIAMSDRLSFYTAFSDGLNKFFEAFMAGDTGLVDDLIEIGNKRVNTEAEKIELKDVIGKYEEVKKSLSKTEFTLDTSYSVEIENALNNNRFLYESILCKCVDRFEYYLRKMLTAVLHQYPGTLGDATVKLKDVMTADNISEIIEKKIEDKVQSLGYDGYDDILNYLNDSFGLGFHPDNKLAYQMTFLLKLRNIVVHNDSRVDRKFLTKLDRNDLKIGAIYELDLQQLFKFIDNLEKFTDQLHKAIRTKFFPENNLPTKRKLKSVGKDLENNGI